MEVEKENRIEAIGAAEHEALAAEEDARESTSCAGDAGVRKGTSSAEGVREIAGMQESAVGAGQ